MLSYLYPRYSSPRPLYLPILALGEKLPSPGTKDPKRYRIRAVILPLAKGLSL